MNFEIHATLSHFYQFSTGRKNAIINGSDELIICRTTSQEFKGAGDQNTSRGYLEYGLDIQNYKEKHPNRRAFMDEMNCLVLPDEVNKHGKAYKGCGVHPDHVKVHQEAWWKIGEILGIDMASQREFEFGRRT